MADGHGEQWRCQGKGSSSSCKQGKDCQQVDQFSPEAIHTASKERTAGFRVFLFVTFADMEHEAEGRGQYQIEAPRDRTPVEQRIGGSPVLDTAHLADPVFACIQNPFTKRVE